MTTAQINRYKAILNAQIAKLNSGQSTFNTNVNTQVSALQSFKSTNDAILTDAIAQFDGTSEQVTALNTAKTRFDTDTNTTISATQTFQSGSASREAAAVAVLTAVRDAL